MIQALKIILAVVGIIGILAFVIHIILSPGFLYSGSRWYPGSKFEDILEVAMFGIYVAILILILKWLNIG